MIRLLAIVLFFHEGIKRAALRNAAGSGGVLHCYKIMEGKSQQNPAFRIRYNDDPTATANFKPFIECLPDWITNMIRKRHGADHVVLLQDVSEEVAAPFAT